MYRQYHKLNQCSRTLLKEKKTVDRLRTLPMSCKNLVNKMHWLEENSLFSSCLKGLFRPASKTTSIESPNVRVLADYWDKCKKRNPFWKTLRLCTVPGFLQRSSCSTVRLSFCNRWGDYACFLNAQNFSAPGADGLINNFWWKSVPVVHLSEWTVA